MPLNELWSITGPRNSRRIGDGPGTGIPGTVRVGYDYNTNTSFSQEAGDSIFTDAELQRMAEDIARWVKNDMTLFYMLIVCGRFFQDLPAPMMTPQVQQYYQWYLAECEAYNLRQLELRQHAGAQYTQGVTPGFTAFIGPPYTTMNGRRVRMGVVPLVVAAIALCVIVVSWIVADKVSETEITTQANASETSVTKVKQMYDFTQQVIQQHPELASQALAGAVTNGNDAIKQIENKGGVSQSISDAISSITTLALWGGVLYVGAQLLKGRKKAVA